MIGRAGAQPSFVILGGGPAGLAAAYKLAQAGWRDVTVLERAERVGGNAGSFVIDGIPVDYGSHRLHPACPAPVMADIRALLGADLLDRPRHGRIRLQGRWVHFPLRPFDFVTHVPPSFLAGVALDAVRKPFASRASDTSFASMLQHQLGGTICRGFYLPYAEKIWGLPPTLLDAEQARRRVSAGSLKKIVGRALRAASGLGRPRGARFFYPRRGYGQISDALRQAAVAAGATVHVNAAASNVVVEGGRVRQVDAGVCGQRRAFPATYVLSTIPIGALARLVRTDGPAPPIDAAQALRHRAMVLVYLTLQVGSPGTELEFAL